MSGKLSVKVIAIVLSLMVVLSLMPLSGIATEEGTCSHVHDAACGFVEGVGCNHVHDERCGGLAAVGGGTPNGPQAEGEADPEGTGEADGEADGEPGDEEPVDEEPADEEPEEGMLMAMGSGGLVGDGPYTATVRYYDNVQIKYSLTYPGGGLLISGDNHTVTADIPVGGTGASDQIYCADPFVPFHPEAASVWSPGDKATVDTVVGYAIAPPWVASTAMNRHYDAICWLAVHGFRGNYLANDGVARQSVTRLNADYSASVGAIDSTIALMATKVAVWKILAGDSVQILGTSLDSNAAKRRTFDALVISLVRDAEAYASLKQEERPPLGATTMSLELTKGAGYGLRAEEGGFDFYGPLRVNASVDSPYSDYALDLDKVFLSAEGPDTSGVRFVSGLSPSDNEFPSSTLYGTARTMQYLSAADFTGGASGDIYMKVPSGRNPANGDRLTVHAMGMAVNVPLIEGTPLVYVFEQGGVYDWNRVQAFVGAARSGLITNIYAEARLTTGDTVLGQLYIAKQVENPSTVDLDREFRFELLHSTEPDPDTATRVNLTTHPVHSAASVNTAENTFTLRKGALAMIDHLPVDDYYWFRELDVPDEYSSVQHEISVSASPTQGNQDGDINSMFLVDAPTAMVNYYNTRNVEKAHFSIGKVAQERIGEGPVENVTDLSFELKLESSADNGSTWQAVNLAGRFSSNGGRVTDGNGGVFSLHSKQNAFIELDPELLYRVSEVPGSRFTPMYALVHYTDGGGGSGVRAWEPVMSSDDAPGTFGAGGSYTSGAFAVKDGEHYLMMFTNLDVGLYDLSLSKSAFRRTSEADTDTLFPFQVYYMNHDGLLNYNEPIPLSDGSVRESLAVTGVGAERIVTDASGHSVLYLKHGETATIRGLPAGHYKVVELLGQLPRGVRYAASYTIGGGRQVSTHGGATENFEFLGQTSVEFTNTEVAGGLFRTGDFSNMLLWVILLVVAGLCIFYLLVGRKKWPAPKCLK
ncbi:MAG: hypothetical protein FWH32_07605 [Clostridiales bacterium]|nr:hypothetical protein [Clostridiales bacterium]